MRRMYSEKQIKNLIEDDLSNAVITKGQYTSSADIKMTRVGHCITISGFFIVNNTTESSQDLAVFKINNVSVSDNIDGDIFSLIKSINNVYSFSVCTISVSDNNLYLTVIDVPTGETTYIIDVDIIDDSILPVEDYPGE